MNKLTTTVAVLLIVFLVLTELHSIVDALFPAEAQKKYDLFLSPSFHMKLSVQWYLKFVFDDLFLIVFAFVGAKVAYRYSYKLFLVMWVIFGYFVFDLASFFWNYKSSFRAYWAVLFFAAVGIILLVWPRRKKEEGLYKSMD